MQAQLLEFEDEEFVNAVFRQLKYLDSYQQATIVLDVLMFIEFIQYAQNASRVIIASIL